MRREQRDRDAGEAVARREAGDEAMDEAERMNAAGEPADDAGGDHHAHENARQIDADRAAETRVEPGQARAKARDGETAPEAVSDHQREADEESEIQRRSAAVERGSSAAATIGGVAELAEPRREQRAVDEPARQVDGDEVQHQRRDDLVDAEAGAQEARADQPEPADDATRRRAQAESTGAPASRQDA